MGRSWLENTATWHARDWVSVIVDFAWEITKTDERHVRDLDEAIAWVDAHAAEAAVSLSTDGRALIGSVARPDGEDIDVVMARLLYLHPLATKSLAPATLAALVDARGLEDGWRFPRYFPRRQLVAGWDAREPAAVIENGLTRGAAVAIGELQRAGGERKLEGLAKLIEVCCGALKYGANEAALDHGLAKTLGGLIPMSIAREADVADRARVEFVTRAWETLRPWRAHLSRLVLELATVCPTVASASMVIDALDADADHWTLKRVLFELCAIAHRPDDMTTYLATPQGRKLLRLQRPSGEPDEALEIATAYERSERFADALAVLDRAKPNGKRREARDRLRTKAGVPSDLTPADPLAALEAALSVGVVDPSHLAAVTDPEQLAALLSRRPVADEIASAIAVRIVELAIAPKTIWVDADLARSVTLAAVKTALSRAQDDGARAAIRTKLRKQTKRIVSKGGYFERELALAIDDALA